MLDLPEASASLEDAGGKRNRRTNVSMNKLDHGDRPIHDWYRFVLSFPPHLVRNYLLDFRLGKNDSILDPFCGTGTTLVESKLNGFRPVGVEANPFAHFASSVKLDWSIDPNLLAENANQIADKARRLLCQEGINDGLPYDGKIENLSLQTLDSEREKLLLTNSISPLPLHKSLVLLNCLEEHQGEPYYRHALLALAKALVFKISNLRFGPEAGVDKPKSDAPVISSWLHEISGMVTDLRRVHSQSYPEGTVLLGDARRISGLLDPECIDAVITSPPYPNEKDYSRTTRLESVVLDFISSKAELRDVKKMLVRSNTRGVYRDDDDDRWIANYDEIQQIAEEIERRRLELGKTSGFEKLYGTVTKLYFGGMAHHLSELRTVLRPGAQLAYVVGDQASYLRTLIRTGHLLIQIAQSLGYELVRTDLFRTRFATATGEQLREEVVVLRWPG